MGCCPKWDRRTQNEYGAFVESGRVGTQRGQVSEFHARQAAAQRAWRQTVASGDANRRLDIKYK